MRDYAKKDFSVPKRAVETEPSDSPVVGFIVIMIMGAAIGAMLGYGLLYTGV